MFLAKLNAKEAINKIINANKILKYMNKIFTFLVLTIILILTSSCTEESKHKKSREVVDKFEISEYEFEVEKIIKTDRETGSIVEIYYDTTLVNLCNLCQDCEDDEREYIPVRR